MPPVHSDASAKLFRVRKHRGHTRGHVDVKDANSDILFQHLAQAQNRPVAKRQAIPFSVRHVMCIRLRREAADLVFGWIPSRQRGITNSLEFQVVLTESLKVDTYGGDLPFLDTSVAGPLTKLHGEGFNGFTATHQLA